MHATAPAPPQAPAAPPPAAPDGVPAWLTHRGVWHASYWVCSLATEVLPVLGGGRGNPTVGWLRSLALLYLLIAIPGYVNTWVLVPRLARRGHARRYALAAAALVLGWAALMVAYYAGGEPATGRELAVGYARWVLWVLAFGIPVAAFDLAAVQLRAQRLRAEREREHAERRLEHLRSQLNPHFLFNTLNSLYALAIERSPQLPELILKHAALLRYALYGAGRERVPLEAEVEFVAGYVELERLRVDESADVRLEVAGVVGAQPVAPLLLIPLVENAFKHLGGAPAFVHAHLDVGPRSLRLSLRNSCDPPPASAEGGIGLRNTRERLALLYPGRHSLSVRREAGAFAVELSVELLP